MKPRSTALRLAKGMYSRSGVPDPRRELFDRVCLNCLTYLETFDECSGVNFSGDHKASSFELEDWEKKNLPYKLPDDMKGFYGMFNGFKLSFDVGVGTTPLSVGKMHLNSLKELERLPLEGRFPGFDDVADMTSAAFILDDTLDEGNIVLLYRSTADKEKWSGKGMRSSSKAVGIGSSGSSSLLAGMVSNEAPPSLEVHPVEADTDRSQSSYKSPEVWFQDRSARWHFLSRSFSDFLRLMVVHVGVIGWPLAYTPEGLSPQTQQWLGLFSRERLCMALTLDSVGRD